jgi:hypothetical protein
VRRSRPPGGTGGRTLACVSPPKCPVEAAWERRAKTRGITQQTRRALVFAGHFPAFARHGASGAAVKPPGERLGVSPHAARAKRELEWAGASKWATMGGRAFCSPLSRVQPMIVVEAAYGFEARRRGRERNQQPRKPLLLTGWEETASTPSELHTMAASTRSGRVGTGERGRKARSALKAGPN